MNKKTVVRLITLIVLFTSTGVPTLLAQTEPPTSRPATAAPSENQNILGLTVGPTSGVRGVTVKAIAPGSPCEGVLKPNDTIYAVTPDSQPGARVNMTNFQAEMSKIQPGTTVKLLVTVRTPILEVTCTVPTDIGRTTPAAVPPQ
jgi:hypothetical protein